jgi:hypothetical protein
VDRGLRLRVGRRERHTTVSEEKMKRATLAIALLALVALAAASVSAATISYSQSKAVSTVGWTQVLAMQQFDPSLGALNSVTFSLAALCEGSGFAENMSTTSTSPFNWELSVLVQLKRADNSLLLQLQPFTASPVYTLGVFDGAMDFGGTSGITDPKSCNDSGSVAGTVGDLAAFTGNGTVNVTAVASAKSKVYGGGNIVMGTSTGAGADVTVTYDYTPVPEPSSMLALIAGLGSLLAFRRRRA